jgi:hypothetical protein
MNLGRNLCRPLHSCASSRIRNRLGTNATSFRAVNPPVVFANCRVERLLVTVGLVLLHLCRSAHRHRRRRLGNRHVGWRTWRRRRGRRSWRARRSLQACPRRFVQHRSRWALASNCAPARTDRVWVGARCWASASACPVYFAALTTRRWRRQWRRTGWRWRRLGRKSENLYVHLVSWREVNRTWPSQHVVVSRW